MIIKVIHLSLFLLCLIICACDGKNKQKSTLSMEEIEGLGVIEAIDKIAQTDPKYEDYRADEIRIVLSKVSDPKLLFDYLVEFDKKYRAAGEGGDGKCFPCGRYENALD